MKLQLDANTVLGLPLVSGHCFVVTFFIGGWVPNPLDIRFQKVSGLKATVGVEEQAEGGQNLYTQKLPTTVKYDNLKLERGMVIGSYLQGEFNAAMTLFKFAPSNVMVTLFAENGFPLGAWFFYRAFPVSWTTSDLDASKPELMVDTLELAYARMQILRV